MKKIVSFILVFLCSSFLFGQNVDKNLNTDNTKKENNIPVHFNLRLDAGVAHTYTIDLIPENGFTSALTGSIELPLNKKGNWNVNIGARFSEYTYYNGSVVNTFPSRDMWYFDIPVVFSYDFKVNQNSKFRLGVGLFYSQVIAERFHENGNDLSYVKASDILTTHNVGPKVDFGFLYKNFYFGGAYECLVQFYDGGDFITFVRASIGYRF